MSSVLTWEQCEILRVMARGRRTPRATRPADLRLLQRAGLIARACARTRFRLTEAGKRYVAFIEAPDPAPPHEPTPSLEQARPL